MLGLIQSSINLRALWAESKLFFWPLLFWGESTRRAVPTDQNSQQKVLQRAVIIGSVSGAALTLSSSSGQT